MNKQWISIVAAIGLVLAACSGSDDAVTASAPSEATATTAPTPATAAADAPDAADAAAFCGPANDFVTSSDVRLINAPDAQIFALIDAQLVELSALAPDQVAGYVSSLQTGFTVIGDAYAEVDYEPTATISVPGQVQQDSAVASEGLERYLIASCDLDSLRDEQILQIQDAFGLEDLATAECLHTQLGDIANIESASLTPELMTTPVCGTSILGMLSGAETTGS